MAHGVKVSPDLAVRKAKCEICNTWRPSSWDLDFFKYKPDREFDEFYCGCLDSN